MSSGVKRDFDVACISDHMNVSRETENVRDPSGKIIDQSEQSSDQCRGVIIWDVDDTIVVIKGIARQHPESDQAILMKTISTYVAVYADTEFFFNDALRLGVVEKLRDWEVDYVQRSKKLKEENEVTELNEKDVTADGRSYSEFLKSQYQAFQMRRREYLKRQSEISGANVPCINEDESRDIREYYDNIYDRMIPGWKELSDAMECKTSFWTKHTRTVLSHLKKNNVRNMIVTACEIPPTIAKLIMWDLFEFFDVNDIYSSVNATKGVTFQHLLEDLGAGANPPEFIAACGDSTDELSAARQFKIPFQDISSIPDLYLVPGKLHPTLAMSVPAECLLQKSPSTLTEEEKLQVINSEQEVLKKCEELLTDWYRDKITRKSRKLVDNQNTVKEREGA